MDSGLKVILKENKTAPVVALQMWVKIGSADESDEEAGMCHFIEHMLFKGTSKKSSLEIVKLIEGLGGAFDAFTTKESLVIVTKFLSEHMARVLDLILEVLFESKIAGDDFKKERSVILEEIKTTSEDPGDHVFDMLFNLLFRDHPMGIPIGGSARSVRNITLDAARDYYQDLLKKKMIIAVSGNYEHHSLLDLATRRFAGHVPLTAARTPPGKYARDNAVQRKKDITQVHVAFGMPAIAYSSQLRYPVLLLNTMFGGGMSSRLFQGLREKEGLVYDVHAFSDLYTDCGILGLYLVCDKKNLGRVARILRSIFTDLQSGGFSDEEINIAKTYITGNLLLSLESSTTRMLRLGREMSYLDRVIPVDETVQAVNRITSKEIGDLISIYLDPGKYSVAAVGPVGEKEIDSFYNDVIP
jgi:predicted Zn-dependent peptidase